MSQGIIAVYRNWEIRLAKDILARKKDRFFKINFMFMEVHKKQMKLQVDRSGADKPF